MSDGKILDIDDDLWATTVEYVKSQVEIMRKYESLPADWSETREFSLAREVAQYPQRLRNMCLREARLKQEGLDK